MNIEYITGYNAASYNVGRGGYAVSEYVYHHWGEDGQTFEGVCSWFQNPACPTSAHFVVEARRVACLVDLCDTAFHAGNYYHNQISIGIECRPEMSAEDLETACQLQAGLFKRFGVHPIVGHKDISPTACPGRWYSQLDYIYNRALEIMNESEDDDEMKWAEFEKSKEYKLLKRLTQAQDADKPSDWAEKEWAKAVEEGITDGSRPQAVMTRQEGAAMLLRSK